jgi:hypothetical protein
MKSDDAIYPPVWLPFTNDASQLTLLYSVENMPVLDPMDTESLVHCDPNIQRGVIGFLHDSTTQAIQFLVYLANETCSILSIFIVDGIVLQEHLLMAVMHHKFSEDCLINGKIMKLYGIDTITFSNFSEINDAFDTMLTSQYISLSQTSQLSSIKSSPVTCFPQQTDDGNLDEEIHTQPQEVPIISDEKGLVEEFDLNVTNVKELLFDKVLNQLEKKDIGIFIK